MAPGPKYYNKFIFKVQLTLLNHLLKEKTGQDGNKTRSRGLYFYFIYLSSASGEVVSCNSEFGGWMHPHPPGTVAQQ